MQESSPIVIFGAPRSGTTYLDQILNKHPDVGISNEARIFAWLHQSLHVLTRCDDYVFGCRDQFIKHLQTMYPDLIRDFYREQFPGKRYWGDKNPHYADPKNQGCLNTIAEVFPSAKFIHIIRDGRDVVSSLIRKRHPDGRPWVDWESAHGVWLRHVSIGCEFGKTLPGAQYFELKYEELISDDVGYARKLFEFLGIPIHPAVLEFSENQQRERTPFSGPTRNLTAGVAASDWASVLCPTDQLHSLKILAPELLRQGYETESSLNDMRQRLESVVRLGLCDETELHLVNDPAVDPVVRRYCQVAQSVLPSTATVAVVSKGDDRLLNLRVRRVCHFPQDDHGDYLGHHPTDSSEAMSHLERLRASGAEYLVFPMFSSWWLDHYSEFRQHLEREHAVVLRDDSCTIFALAEATTNVRLKDMEVETPATVLPSLTGASPSISGQLNLRSAGNLMAAPHNPQELLAAVLSEKPQLHFWKGAWQSGGLSNEMLRTLFDITVSVTNPQGAVVLETGAGLSTLVFLAAQPGKLITIAPDEALRQRIEAQIAHLTLDGPDHSFHVDRSENVLPGLAVTRDPYVDVALIDGGHGMPTVFVDFCYINSILKSGGYLAVDDLQLHSVRQLYLLLKKQPGFEVAHEFFGKLVIFRKTENLRFLPDWGGQPFVACNS